ncbi:galectin [Elysia marginata]|uniref:Galectin n=1 Tax=Elysia marginata TaxID=1093978 RepID=A0AAV4JWP2_9GAST|nr:galectin [Elysia marginata]
MYLQTLPTVTQVKGGPLSPGRKVFIYGKPTADAARFNVNLLVGDEFATSDLALHFDVRFDFGTCQNMLVFNHRNEGKFGDEERITDNFPFVRDQRFELTLILKEDCYEIWNMGEFLSSFPHRILPPVPVQNVHIRGDVVIEKIFYE